MVTPFSQAQGIDFSPVEPFEALVDPVPVRVLTFDTREHELASTFDYFRLEATFPDNPAAATP